MSCPAPLAGLRRQIRSESPLIHCITNHIAIRDCANGLLALGARPIMAEHPGEVAEVTAVSRALVVNLGNITDSRLTAMTLAGQTARQESVPCLIDVVGVGCSRLRLNFARQFLAAARPAVLKGNQSELQALCGLAHHAKGIDNGEGDNLTQAVAVAQQAAQRFSTVVLLSGKSDVISDGLYTTIVDNGDPLMARVTGTGCLQGAVVGAFLSVTDPFSAAVSGAAMLALAGERAAASFPAHKSLSRFAGELVDGLFSLPDEVLSKSQRLRTGPF